jgi:hypothetical protein
MTHCSQAACTPGQMAYDLRRLRLTGLILRLPHSNRTS